MYQHEMEYHQGPGHRGKADAQGRGGGACGGGVSMARSGLGSVQLPQLTMSRRDDIVVNVLGTPALEYGNYYTTSGSLTSRLHYSITPWKQTTFIKAV